MATAKKSTSRAVVPWEQEMANRAKKAAKQEVPFSAFKKISTAGGIMKVDDEPIEGNCLRVVVVAALHENQYYDKPYDPRNPTVPVCYAYNDPNNDEADPEDTMTAHADAEQPQGQADPSEEGAAGNPCNDCWANKMGSADVGRGKACKNIRRLAVVTEDALESAEALEAAEVRMLNVPVMSTRNWAKFVNKVADEMSRDYSGVVATVAVVPDPKSQFLVTFAFEELINFDQALWEAMEKKRKEAMEALLQPYPKQADLDAANAPAAKPMKAHGRAAQAMARGGKPAAKTPAKGKKF